MNGNKLLRHCFHTNNACLKICTFTRQNQVYLVCPLESTCCYDFINRFCVARYYVLLNGNPIWFCRTFFRPFLRIRRPQINLFNPQQIQAMHSPPCRHFGDRMSQMVCFHDCSFILYEMSGTFLSLHPALSLSKQFCHCLLNCRTIF